MDSAHTGWEMRSSNESQTLIEEAKETQDVVVRQYEKCHRSSQIVVMSYQPPLILKAKQFNVLDIFGIIICFNI